MNPRTEQMRGPILKRRAETPRPPRPVRGNRRSGLKRLPCLGLSWRGLSGLAWLGLLSDNSHHSRTRASFSRNRFFDFAWIFTPFSLQTPILFWYKIMCPFGCFLASGLAWAPLASPGLSLAAFWRPLASPWPPFGLPWRPLGHPLAPLWRPLASLGRFFGASKRLLACLLSLSLALRRGWVSPPDPSLRGG